MLNVFRWILLIKGWYMIQKLHFICFDDVYFHLQNKGTRVFTLSLFYLVFYPSKSEIRLTSKTLIDRIIKEVKRSAKMNQCRKTSNVMSWLKKLARTKHQVL